MNEKNLIFLISQPRSGSSMLQQLLLTSQVISSSPESWQMLSLIHTYKETNISNNYNPNFATINFVSYLNQKEIGLADFKEKIKKLALSLYDDKRGKNDYFLDKTPRYYHIIDELYEFFPNAKYIFLKRHPIAVYTSILNYNFYGDSFEFLKQDDRLDDLFLAPTVIKNATKKYKNHVLVSYEDVVQSAETTLKKISNYLDIDIPVDAPYKLKGEFINSGSIDTKSLKDHDKPVRKYLDTWKSSLKTTQEKKLVLDYLKRLIGGDGIYSSIEIENIIAEVKKIHPKKRTYFNLSFDILAQKEENLSILALNKKRLYRKLKFLLRK